MATTKTKPSGPPYMSWATLENLLDRMEKDGLPGRIDRSVLAGSEGYKTQVLAGMRWLGLIGPNGEVTPVFEGLVSGDRQEKIGELFGEKYSRQIGLGKKNASQRELEESFEPYTGDTARKAVSFYLKGARFAGLPLSAYFKMPRTRGPASGKPGARKRTTKPKPSDNGSAAGLNIEGLHPALAGLLEDLPRGGSGWTEAKRDEFMDAFQVMIRYAVPIADTDESSGDDEEESEQEEDE